MRPRVLLPALALALVAAAARPAAAETAYAIGNGGASLLRFQTESPGVVTSIDLGGAAEFLDAIDFRPATGQLYGYLDDTDSFYTVNLDTGALTLAAVSSVRTNTFRLGIDFNPTVDRLRIVTESQQNLRSDVTTGITGNDPALQYAAGDVNANSLATLVVEAAYTNNDNSPATATTLYYIDHGLDILATTADANSGVLNTVGPLGFDTSDLVGFDIFTSITGVNTAFALLTVGGTPGLYTINLATGQATSLGALGVAPGSGNAYSLAVVPVPEPSAVVLLGAGLAAVGLLAARRRAGVAATAGPR